MKAGPSGLWHLVPWMYAVVVIAAILVDLFTDRSGGAFSLATLLVALVAAACFLGGQVSTKIDAKRILVHWAIGVLLIFLGLVAFASKGGLAPKEGELIFTYAMLMAAPPVSLLLPLVTPSATGHAFGDVLMRSMVTWGFVLAFGCLQWGMVRWLLRKLSAVRTKGIKS